ncbi:uncharacterized protein LOC129743454 [Uranotaenia lowii]|uniref:uncharacterized protein LOC129743454 n=1 Tax=Uranotaenia lowii TaxID=190385 RepID=UPI002478960F|nr:uncharacterized protein LOC129743454 [Uranotaenia lowii]
MGGRGDGTGGVGGGANIGHQNISSAGVQGGIAARPVARVDIQPVINRSDLKSSIFHPSFHRQFVTNISTESGAPVEPVHEENNSDSYEDSLKDSLTSNTSL